MKDRKFFINRLPGFIGIRVGRWYVKVKDTRRHRLLFSERNGYTPTLQIGAWAMVWDNCGR